MSAKRLVAIMVVGSAVVLLAGSRRHPPAKRPAPPPAEHERAWLSREAAAQVVWPGGQLGPLFAGVDLGGPPPTAEVRARIAAFARANDVEIAIEEKAGEVAAVRFAVTFGGCCGYEAADVLALRMHRPKDSECCGCAWQWRDDWATSDGITYAHARVRVNRFAVRWEAALTMGELLDRANALIGKPTASVRDTRWAEIVPGSRYAMEIPLALDTYPEQQVPTADIRAEHGRIVEVSVPFRADADAPLRGRWGRPRIHAESSTWRATNRTITSDGSTIAIRSTLDARCARPAPRCAIKMR